MATNQTPIGDGLSLALNVSYHVEGELQRRPGLSGRIDLTSFLYGAVQHPEAGHFFVVVGDGELVGYDLDDGAQTSLYTLAATYTGACFANARGQLYYEDGILPMLVVARGDEAATTAGIAPPTAAPTVGSPSGGDVTAGAKTIRYRYFNATTGYYSDPSPAVAYTAAGSEDIPLTTVASSDTKVTNIIVEMTVSSGTAYFQAGLFANGTTCTVDISDTDLAVQVAASTYAAPDGYGHGQPPVARLLIEHRGRLFAWGAATITGATADVDNGSAAVDLGADADQGHAYIGRVIRFNADNAVYTIVEGDGSNVVLNIPYAGMSDDPADFTITDPGEDTLWWSRALFPEGWNLTDWGYSVIQGLNADLPSGMISYYNDLYCCGQRCIRRLTYEVDPAVAEIFTVSTNLGTYNQQCLVRADGIAFGMGQAGIWLLDGTNPTHISDAIDEFLRDDKDDAFSSKYFGFYDSVERVVWWCYVQNGEEDCRRAVCYELDTKRWMIRSFRNVVRAGFAYGDRTLAETVYIATGDGDGYTWKLTRHAFDGLATGMTTGAFTAAAGSTTTVLNLQEPVGDVVGAMAFLPETDEERVITVAGANSITVSPAIANAPVQGDPVYIGSIPVDVIHFWDVYGQRLANKQRPATCEFEHLSDPDEPAVIGLTQLYLDFSASPFDYGDLEAGELQSRGVTSYDDTTKALDLSVILVAAPCPSEWKRSIRWRFQQLKPEGFLRLVNVGFYGDPAKDTKQDIQA